jgi:ATP-binding cassette, subfamily C (CFTR/MRP), member 1
LLGESVEGVAVIRAFSAEESLFARMITMLDTQQHAYFLTYVGQSWLGIRLELVGTLIIAFACLMAVFQHVFSVTDAGLAGLAISYALSVTQSLNWTVRMASDLEANMVAVERVTEYTKLENEGTKRFQSHDKVLLGWPTSGEIEFKNVLMRYRPELPLVLKGLNIHIPGGSKIGVVGRTGAGKSSLMVALLRLVDLNDGTILIDKTDITILGLAKLRENIAVIPQDPVLFSGTVRSNLDPFDEYTDESLYEVLEDVGLFKPKASSASSESLKSLSNVRIHSLDDIVLESGSNFSNGQRQLIVIARALMRRQKIVISDEATASVDGETDDAIQKVFRTKFVNATCITIAHRLNTIMDSDYILVMDDGRAAEFDTPKNLLQKGGMFRDLVQAAKGD